MDVPVLIIPIMLAGYVAYILIIMLLMQGSFNHYRKIQRKVRGGQDISIIAAWFDEFILFHMLPIKTKTGNPTFLEAIDRYNTLNRKFWRLLLAFFPLVGGVYFIVLN